MKCPKFDGEPLGRCPECKGKVKLCREIRIWMTEDGSKVLDSTTVKCAMCEDCDAVFYDFDKLGE